MNKVCCFIGHRKIDLTKELEVKTRNVIEDLIIKKEVATFLFGSNSEFDNLCHKIVTDLKEYYPYIKRVAYTCKSEGCTLESEKQKWEQIYFNLYKKMLIYFVLMKNLNIKQNTHQEKQVMLKEIKQ